LAFTLTKQAHLSQKAARFKSETHDMQSKPGNIIKPKHEKLPTFGCVCLKKLGYGTALVLSFIIWVSMYSAPWKKAKPRALKKAVKDNEGVIVILSNLFERLYLTRLTGNLSSHKQLLTLV